MKHVQFGKKILSALTALATVAALCACSAQPGDTATTGAPQEPSAAPAQDGAGGQPEQGSGAQPITLKFLTLSDWGGEMFQPMTDAYQEIAPNVRFEFETYPFQEMLKVIQVKMSAGDTTYDLLSVDGPLNANYAYRGFLLPMDEYLSPGDKEAMVPSSLQAMTYDGKIYSAPMATASCVIYYNKDLFDQAGVPYPSAEKSQRMTWEQVAGISKTIMDKLNPGRDNGIWALALEQITSTYNVIPLVNSLGGTGVGEDGLTVDGVINAEPWVKGMTYYGNLYNEWKFSPKEMDPDQVRGLFTSGKLAMLVGAVEFAKNHIEKNNPGMNWGFAPHPYFEGGQVVTPTGSWHYGVNAASAHPKECMDFVRWAVWGAGSDISLEKVYPNLPCRYDQIEKLQADTSDKYTGFRAHYKLCVDEAMNTAVPRPLTIAYSDWDSIMMTVYQDIRNGADPKERLDMAVEELQPAMDRYRQQ